MFRRVGPAVLLSVALIFFFISPLYAADDIVLDLGVCRLESRGAAVNAIASGISSRFFESVSGIAEHKLTQEEFSTILGEEKKEQLNSETAALEKLYSERDGLIFSYNKEELSEAIAEKQELITEKLKKINELKKDREQIVQKSFNREPVSALLNMKKPDDGLIFERVPGAIKETAAEYGLDFLVYGFIETINEYEYVEVRLWNDILEEDSYVWRTALSSETVNDLVTPGINGMKTVLYGREWAEISITGPDNSMIYINDEFAGIGSINSRPVDPGETEIELKKPGSKSLRKLVNVPSESDTELVLEMDEVDPGYVIIQTWPAGANVYLDSVWTGTSPVKLYMQNETSAVRITRDGYEERNFFLERDADKILNVNLKPEVSERDEWVPAYRRRFYTSMGSFMLSIPLTALFSSMLDQSASAYRREYEGNGDLNVEELNRLFYLNRAEYGMYIASVGLNVFLLFDTIIQAVEYVSSVDYFSD